MLRGEQYFITENYLIIVITVEFHDLLIFNELKVSSSRVEDGGIRLLIIIIRDFLVLRSRQGHASRTTMQQLIREKLILGADNNKKLFYYSLLYAPCQT